MDLAKTSCKEVERERSTNQKMLNKLENGSKCPSLGQGAVAKAWGHYTTTKNSWNRSKQTLSNARNRRVTFSSQRYNTMQRGNCGFVFSSRNYLNAKRALDNAVRQELILKGKTSGAHTAWRLAVAAAAKLKRICHCDVQVTARNLWKTVGSAKLIKKQNRAHTKCKMMGCVLKGTNVRAAKCQGSLPALRNKVLTTGASRESCAGHVTTAAKNKAKAKAREKAKKEKAKKEKAKKEKAKKAAAKEKKAKGAHGSFRLVNKHNRVVTSGGTGTLQVKRGHGWGAVCDDRWENAKWASNNANMACRAMGFKSWVPSKSSSAIKGGTAGSTSKQAAFYRKIARKDFAMDDLQCPTGANRLSQCTKHSCSAKKSSKRCKNCSTTEQIILSCSHIGNGNGGVKVGKGVCYGYNQHGVRGTYKHSAGPNADKRKSGKRNVRTLAQCRAYCAGVSGCNYFSWGVSGTDNYSTCIIFKTCPHPQTYQTARDIARGNYVYA